MPRKAAPKDVPKRCEHTLLKFSPTSHATEVGYKQPDLNPRVAAADPNGSLPTKSRGSQQDTLDASSPSTFPAPLILPGDDLAMDPKHPTQSLRSFIRGSYRNKVTPERRTVYMAAPPAYSKDTKYLEKWTHPKDRTIDSAAKKPDVGIVAKYLEVFYHGLPVKVLDPDILKFTSKIDDEEYVPKETEQRKLIGLETKTENGCKGIRTRPTPIDEYTHQLNLNDLLDAAIWVLPEDAYALLLLVDHDLYEDEEDIFVCGRAYGGSRVAVISTARYHPGLDKEQGVGREHAWPAAHCREYLDGLVEEEKGKKKRKVVKETKGVVRKEKEKVVIDLTLDDSTVSVVPEILPMKSAVEAHHSLPSLEGSPSPKVLSGLWLGRVCRTAGHELGHCFGIGHCVYYACSMQGSASIVEDARQPPYLCPVDLAKVLHATDADVKERYKAILGFCEELDDVHLFRAYGAWIRMRLEQLREVV